MEALLVKLSRRRTLMVPVVTLLAIGLGISGYYIQDRQIAAREEAARQAEQAQQQQPKPVDPVELPAVETVEESTKVTEDGEATEVVDVKLSVQNRPENSEVVLSATVDTEEPGTCVFYLKQGNYGPEETVDVKDGHCEARLQNPGIGEWEAKILFTSAGDGKTRGDAKTTVQL